MEFKNHTPFPALAFEGYDKQDAPFHVVVLRVTCNIVPLLSNDSSPADADGATHQLILAHEQAPLCMVDAMHGPLNQSSVKCESDLVPFKPRCDVIVLAHAYSPTGRPQRGFNVGVDVRKRSTPRPLPPPPLPLNPMMDLTAEQKRGYKAQCAQAAANPLPGQILVQKSLRITGERFFKRSFVLKRILAWLLRIGTLGVVRLKTWTLTIPKPFVYLPVRYEYSFGGQCRIEATDRAMRRVPKARRLRPEQRTLHPDAKHNPGGAPGAHIHCAANPVGRGFAHAWFLNATRTKRLAAPQIEDPEHPIKVSHFWKLIHGKSKAAEHPALQPQGFGVIGKPWTPRLQRAGTYDNAWLNERHPWLPRDFDFSYWNGAPVSLQMPLSGGGEIFTFTNLVPHNNPGARRNAAGQTETRFVLPEHAVSAMLRYESGLMISTPIPIDTVIVQWPDPQEAASAGNEQTQTAPLLQTVTLTYRLTMPDDEPIRLLETLFVMQENA